MNRYLVRFLVASLTFAVGLIASQVTSLFSVSVLQTPPYRVQTTRSGASCYRAKAVVTSPLMSIESQPSAPLRLFYSSTSMDGAEAGRRLVHFSVENKSGRSIKKFWIRYGKSQTSTPYSVVGGTVLIGGDSPTWIFRAGESQDVTIDSYADQTLRMSVYSVEYADGSRWNSRDDR